MATRGAAFTATFMALDSATGRPKTGDSANITPRICKDGTSAALTTGTVAEVDSTNFKGVYSVSVSATEADVGEVVVGGVSSTSGIDIVPTTYQMERLPDAAPGANGGVPTVDGNNNVHGVQPGTGTGQLNPSGGKVPATIASGDYSGNTVQTGDAYAYLTTNLGALGANLTALPALVWNALTSGMSIAGSIAKLIIDNLNATITSRMATYTQPTGFLATDFADLAADVDATESAVTDPTSGNPALLAAIEALDVGAGSGAHAVTITVNDGATALQNATVTLAINASRYTLLTNSSGVAVFTPTENDGTYNVRIALNGYSFSPVDLVVSGDTSHTYSMTQDVPTPSDPGLTTCYLDVIDESGAVAGVPVKLTIKACQAGDTGSGWSDSVLTKLTNGSGRAEFVNRPRLAEYSVSINGKEFNGTTLDASSTPLVNTLGRVVT